MNSKTIFTFTIFIVSQLTFFLSRLRSKPTDKSSDSLLDDNNLYIKETICAWLTTSKCLPELVVNLEKLNKAITARLTNLMSAPSAYL